jgi:hypothetical protein
MRKKPNPELIDAENPEWTTEQITKAHTTLEVLPQIFGAQAAQEMLKPPSSPSGTPELPTQTPAPQGLS